MAERLFDAQSKYVEIYSVACAEVQAYREEHKVALVARNEVETVRLECLSVRADEKFEDQERSMKQLSVFLAPPVVTPPVFFLQAAGGSVVQE